MQAYLGRLERGFLLFFIFSHADNRADMFERVRQDVHKIVFFGNHQ